MGSKKRKNKEKMAKHHQQHEKRIDHFSHKHQLTLIDIDEKDEIRNWEYRSFLRCYGCTEKIKQGVPYYRCEEECPSFCLHHACAHLPTSIKGRIHNIYCGGDLQLMKHPDKDHEYCSVCYEDWYRFTYVCSDCKKGEDIRCAVLKGRNEAKHSFHQHPVSPYFYQGKVRSSPVCAVCRYIITPISGERYIFYRCNYCNFIVHPDCTNVSVFLESPYHPHELILKFDYPGSKICKICQEEIDPNTQWAYVCPEWECDDYYIHGGYDGCLTSTIRKGDLQHFDHKHPLALVEQELEAPLTTEGTSSNDEHSISKDCHCCKQKISSMPYYTCVHCKSYHLHKICALLPTEIQHPLHLKCTLKLSTRLDVNCEVCKQEFNGFSYHCSSCEFDLDIECALKTQKVKKVFHNHQLFVSLTKGPFSCHACDRDNEGSSYQCTSCKFWVHEQCASLPAVKDKSSHEHRHELHLVHHIPQKYSKVVVYCRICLKTLEDPTWAYHCDQCRYFIHVHDCSNPRSEGDGVTINASDVVNLPFDGEPILGEILTDGKMTKHHRHPIILFADQLESNAIGITASFINLIRGSATWPSFRVNGKDYNGVTFTFYNNILTMQVTGVELPRYVKHEDHPHVLESTFLKSSTWCHACEQIFFGLGFKCTACAFTVDTYCAFLTKKINHRYDKHDFSLTYSAVEGVEEYVCEICEEDVIPRYFYHCAACDQSIHARCIWKAYVQFEPYYKFDLGRRYVVLVPPSAELPHCIICKEKDTHGHGFAFLDYNDQKYMVHLTCISEDDLRV